MAPITESLLTIDGGGKSNNLCTDAANQIKWSKVLRDGCDSINNGSPHVRLINDNFLFVSVEVTCVSQTNITIPAYGPNTDNVFWRFIYDGFPNYNNNTMYSEVMVDIDNVLYPAYARAGWVNQGTNEKCMELVLRKNATLYSGTKNIRFTFTTMCEN